MTAFTLGELKDLVTIMQQMSHEADHANWQELARLDCKRRLMIRYDETTNISTTNDKTDVSSASQYPEESTSDQDRTNSTEYSALKNQIRHLDKKILKSITHARDTLINENRGLNAQAKAQRGYANAQSITASVS